MHFRKYFERGLSVIPVHFMGKNPTINTWQKYCETLPSEAEIDAWDRHGGFNIGLACGPASGIVALDIDTDDKEFTRNLPLSPVRRRGKKGEVRFFKFCAKNPIESQTLPFLDILSTGRQVVLPPSTHPDGMKYVWLTDDTLENFDVKDLPELDLSFLGELKKQANSMQIIGLGRNDKLKAIVTSMRGRSETEEKIISEVYKWDLEHHSPRLFTDPRENYKANNEDDARKNAWMFVSRITQSLIRSGVAKPIEVNGDVVIEITEEEIKTRKDAAFKFKPYPRARGIMGLFQELCELKSAGNQDATGLGGAIALMGAIMSNRFVTECRGLTTCPNTYVINLGYSSFGKETAQSLINELLADSGLLGSGNYKSAVSVIMNLPNQQERLDVIDECSTILSAMGSKDGYAAQIVELLSELFTKGSTRYSGQSSLGHGERFGACYNPHISMLGSTTPKGFRTSVNKEVAAKGLLPRMLLFFQHEVGEYKGRQDRSGIKEKQELIQNLVNAFLSREKVLHPDFLDQDKPIKIDIKNATYTEYPMGKRYKHDVIPFTDDAYEAWLNYEEECHNKKKINPEGFESAFIGRFAEHASKLALTDASSLGKSKIDLDSFEWAKEVVETQWHNARPLYEEAHAESQLEGEIFKILNFINKRSSVSKCDLRRQFQRIDNRIYKQALETLLETSQIESREIKTGGRNKVIYISSNIATIST